jgi:hypothetical protein
MAKLKNSLGADMANEFQDVYGKVNADYANEFNEYGAEEQFVNLKQKEQEKDINELIAGRRQGT